MLGHLRRWLITQPLAAITFLGFYLENLLRPADALHSAASNWPRRLLAVSGVKVTTSGTVPAGGPYVIVCNHASLLDTPVLLAYLKLDFRFIAKQSLFDAPIIGLHLRKAGHIAVVREDARGAMQSLADAERVIRERGASVLVFAEGTRSTEGLGEFKTGAAHLAIQAGAPILPVALSGTAPLLPRGAFAIRAGRVHLAIGQPIPVAGLTKRDRESLTAEARAAVVALLQASPAEASA